MQSFADYGKTLFKGDVADEYLKKHGLDASALDDPAWTVNHADAVANAVSDWAGDHEANVCKYINTNLRMKKYNSNMYL